MPQKAPQNLKNATPERSKVDLLVIFGPLLAPIFHRKSRHPENVYFETSIKRELWFCMPKPPILVSKTLHFFMCFWARFWMTFLHHFWEHGSEKCDFRGAFRTLLGPKWHPKSHKWRQNDPQKTPVLLPNATSKTDFLRRCSFGTPWLSFGDILVQFGYLLAPFGCLWVPFS